MHTEWAHHGHVSRHELCGKVVLLQDLFTTPTLGSIKFGNHAALALVATQLIDPVFIGAQGVQSAVHVNTEPRHRIEHGFGGQAGKGVGVGVGVGVG